MGAVKTFFGIVGLAALGIGGFKAAQALPQFISSHPQASAPSIPAVTIQWFPARSTPKVHRVTPSVGGGLGTPTPQSPSRSVNATSLNWAGLVQQGQTERSVQASWTVPGFSAIPSASNSSLAEWIGLGGMQGKGLIQIGTITSPNAAGQAVTTVFWESLPAPAVQVATVPTGAVVHAKITPAGLDQWRLWLQVAGRSTPLINRVITLAPRKAAAVQSSADWITEVPTTSTGVTPLAPIAATTMTNVSVNNVPLSRINPNTLQRIGLYNQAGQLLAEPTATTADNHVVVTTVYGGLASSSSPGIPQAKWVTEPPDGWNSGPNGPGNGVGWGGSFPPLNITQDGNQLGVTWSISW